MNNETTRQSQNNIVKQGTILAVASLLVRFIGLLYRIPMTNSVGDVGMGLYSAAFHLYNVVLILSSYSMPQVVSRLLAMRLAKKQFRNARRYFCCALVVSALFGTVFALLMYSLAPFIARVVFSMPGAVYAIRVLSATVFIVAFLGVFRGFFQGFSQMMPTAISQVIEQIINAIVSVVCAASLFATGAKADLVRGTEYYGPALGACGGTWGTFAGALAALIFVLFLYFQNRPAFMRRVRRSSNTRVYGFDKVLADILMMMIPIVLSSVIFHVLNIIDNAFFGWYMHPGTGTEKEQLYSAIWGIYSAKYQLLINLPISFATALASSAIPELSRAVAKRDKAGVRSQINTSIKFTTVIAIPSMVGLAILGKDLLGMLFRTSSGAASGEKMLFLGALAVVTFSLATITNGILQGLGYVMAPVKNALIGLGGHLLLLIPGLWLLKGGIYAVIVSYMVFGGVVSVLNIIDIRKAARYKLSVFKIFILPLLTSTIMGIVVWLLNRLLWQGLSGIFGDHTRIICIFTTMIPILVGVVIYLLVSIVSGALSREDLYQLPMGGRLVKLAAKWKLLR